ncbi:hypothetical protein BSLG_005637 [Batrachochytrium salamandrivorans]|nr:hypothetical protein BSLG_005637 [Batrachochytrium salamandrivorans]
MEAAIGRFTAWVQGYLASESSTHYQYRRQLLKLPLPRLFWNKGNTAPKTAGDVYESMLGAVLYEYGLHGGTTATITYHNMVLAQCLGTGQRDAKKQRHVQPSNKDKPTRSNKESARLSIEYATTTDQQDPASDWGESVDHNACTT